MRARTIISRIATLGLAAMLIAGCGGSGDDESTDSGDDAAPTKTATTATTATDGEGDTTPSQPVATSGKPRFVINVEDGVVEGGPQAMRVKQGEHVTIVIRSNTADEAHLHGIDKEIALVPGTAAELAFVAADEGSYELELHEAGTSLGTVEVR